jgi:hypothetical protein
MFDVFTAFLAALFIILALAAHLRRLMLKPEITDIEQNEWNRMIQHEMARRSLKTNIF